MSAPLDNRTDTMSTTHTVNVDDHTDGTVTPRTLTDANPLDAQTKTGQVAGAHDAALPATSTLGKVEAEMEKQGKTTQKVASDALSSLPASRKNILTLCFCLSMVSHLSVYLPKS